MPFGIVDALLDQREVVGLVALALVGVGAHFLIGFGEALLSKHVLPVFH